MLVIEKIWKKIYEEAREYVRYDDEERIYDFSDIIDRFIKEEVGGNKFDEFIRNGEYYDDSTLNALLSEVPVEVDWSRVPKNTPIVVGDEMDGNTILNAFRGYFSHIDDHGLIHIYVGGGTNWSSGGLTTSYVFGQLVNDDDRRQYIK